MKHEPGYEASIVKAYLTEHGERRPDDGQLIRLNDRRITDSHKDMTRRWERLDTVPMNRLDKFLMRYDLMLFELEDWARDHYGRDGFVDPYLDPKDLVA